MNVVVDGKLPNRLGKLRQWDDAEVPPALKGRILAQEKTMLSPVLLGLKTSKARALGWDTQEPTWKDIADAAKAGKFTFGMTNPASSNTGLTATIGLASALAKNPDALTEEDLKNPRLADFFKGQSLTSGSSGCNGDGAGRSTSRFRQGGTTIVVTITMSVAAPKSPASKTPDARPIRAKISPTSPRGIIPTPMMVLFPRNQKGA